MGWDASGACEALHPSQRFIHTQHASFVLRRLLDAVTTGNDQTIKSGTFRKAASKHPRLLRRVLAHHRHWLLGLGQSRSLLGYILNCTLYGERTMWQPGSTVVLISLNSAGVGPGYSTTEGIHIMLPPHELALA